MRIDEPGFVTERILLLGGRQVTSYLVMGDTYAWIGGGTAWGVARLEEQLDRFNVDRSRVRYLVISHAHHDHCGAVPYLLRRYPHLEVVSSPYGAEILGKEKPVRLMEDINRRTSERLGRPYSHDGVPLDFEAVPVAHRVGDGDSLELGGGLTLRFFLTPGHSRCSLTAYVPELEALFPGDSIPYPEAGREDLTVTANHDYEDYLASLRTLEPLPIQLVGLEHGGALTGLEAEGIIRRGLDAAERQRERIRERYRELGDVDRLVDEIASKYHALELFQLTPGDVMRAIIQRMVKSALGVI
ncbi:MAG: MBL fold metallo-hydrolase [Deltaproteobacteria bacterium]|nr:MBL fold metallo-hydrolase [Deltaproteobacteria bacterium]